METIEKVYEFASKRNREGIILDTVVLLLYLVGKYDIQCIKSFEPTHHYEKEDFDLLIKLIKPFKKIIVTPHIIAEVSNISLRHMKNARLQQYLCVLVDQLKDKNITDERHIYFDNWQDKTIGRLVAFGFTDMGIYEVSKENNLPIITDDQELYNFSKSKTPIIKLSVIKYSNFKF